MHRVGNVTQRGFKPSKQNENNFLIVEVLEVLLISFPSVKSDLKYKRVETKFSNSNRKNVDQPS